MCSILALHSCSPKAEENATSQDVQSAEKSYHFEEGENIHWEANVEGEYIIIRAWLNTGWTTYSVHNNNFPGPLPTLISFDNNEHFELVGDIEEVGVKSKIDEESKTEIGYFKDLAIFKQKIKSISGEEFVVSGYVNYMICNSNKCLPPVDYNFELTIKP